MTTLTHSAWSLLLLSALSVSCGSSDTDPLLSTGGTGAIAGAAGSALVAGGSSAQGGASSAGATGLAGSSGTAAASGSANGGSNGSAGSAGSSANSGSAGGAGLGAGGANAGPPSKRQTAKPIGGASTAPNGYYEYLPPGYNGSAATPLLVFWHGIGEDGNGGSDLQKVLMHGPPGLISKDHWDNARPFIVLSPQYKPTSGAIAVGGGCPSNAIISAFFSWAIAHYAVDLKRVYLTGLSCGAIGSWDYLAEQRGSVVAAAVLLSGNPGDPTQTGSTWQRAGCGLGTAAIWSLHGDADPIVPYGPDHNTLSNLKACPTPPRRDAVFTDIVKGGHDIWDATYDLSGSSGDIYKWLLDNAKP